MGQTLWSQLFTMQEHHIPREIAAHVCLVSASCSRSVSGNAVIFLPGEVVYSAAKLRT